MSGYKQREALFTISPDKLVTKPKELKKLETNNVLQLYYTPHKLEHRWHYKLFKHWVVMATQMNIRLVDS